MSPTRVSIRAAVASSATVFLCLLAAQGIGADADLRALLVDPAADWLEVSATPNNLEGSFTAHTYGVYEGDNGASEDALKKYNFVAGYDREWEQKVTQDYLVERVFEFESAAAAGYWYGDLKLDAQTSKYFKRDIPAIAAAKSFGAALDFSDGTHGYRLFFTKANLMFAVDMEADTNDLSAAALARAQALYDAAPESGIPVSGPPANSPQTNQAIGTGLVALAVVLSLAIFMLIRYARRGRRQLYPSAGAVQMSGDGAYWWDGQRWRSVATDPPPPGTGTFT